jgi:hypothetical protein
MQIDPEYGPSLSFGVVIVECLGSHSIWLLCSGISMAFQKQYYNYSLHIVHPLCAAVSSSVIRL